jgi:hypothetical protein
MSGFMDSKKIKQIPNLQEQLLMTYATVVKTMEVAARFHMSFLALLEELDRQGIVDKDKIEHEGLKMSNGLVENLRLTSKDLEYMSKMTEVIKLNQEFKEQDS